MVSGATAWLGRGGKKAPEKSQIPKPKLRKNSKTEFSKHFRPVWDLRFGILLGFGIWFLGFGFWRFTQCGCLNTRAFSKSKFHDYLDPAFPPASLVAQRNPSAVAVSAGPLLHPLLAGRLER